MLLPILIGLIAWTRRSSTAIVLTHALLSGACFMAMILPWTIRNYAVHHKLVLVATNGGSTFYGSNNTRVLREPEHFGGWVATNYLPGRDLVEATPDEVAHDKVEWTLGMDWVSAHLTSLPLLCVYKLWRLWLPDFDSRNRNYVIIQFAAYTPFMVLFILGFWRCLRQSSYWTPPWMTLHCVMMGMVVSAMIFWGAPRFRDANLAPLMAYAAVGVQCSKRRWARRSCSDPRAKRRTIATRSAFEIINE